MPQNRPRRAFTLTELLIAIGIIVILIGLLLPVVTKVRRAAYGASTQQQISALSSAIEAYHNDFNAYPGPLPLNQINVAQSSTDTTATNPLVYNLSGTAVNLSTTTAQGATIAVGQISGAENLVLGLLGGLTVTRNASGQLDITAYQYDATRIFTTDSTGKLTTIPGPGGAQSLAIGTSKTYSPYITVQASDLSATTATASFADAAGRMPKDTIIPVFVDKYPDAMPILYMRAQRGAAGLVSFAGDTSMGANALSPDPVTNQAVSSWQYDLREIYPYTNSDGTTATSNIGLNYTAKINRHGLQMVWNSANTPATYQISGSAPIDAWAYLRNPSMGPTVPTSGSPTDVGVPRQKDTYILISAGPDRTYGTSDDITNFGSVGQ
jgi:prepilin-type N-terminal cleavage/methylation domain-containing protein